MKNDEVNNVDQAIEEYYGLEKEMEFDDTEDIDNEVEENPFDADKIRINQEMLSVKYMMDLIVDGQLILNPEFQRYSVWKERKRKSLLIESLMLRIPIPAFYFYEDKDSKLIVIDGQQRLTTIKEFVEGKFRLSGLEYLGKECNGLRFSDLSSKYVQRIYRTQLAVNTLDARSPTKVIYEIFRRVNTGGVSLRPQEIRNSIAEHKVRQFLIKLRDSKEFKNATRSKVKDDRMDAQEIILRYIAFHMNYDWKKERVTYDSKGMANFLDDALISLNEYDDAELENLELDFKNAMERAYDLFGKYSFSKVNLNSNNKVTRSRDIINKSLFASFAIVLTHPRYENVNFKSYRQTVLRILAEKLYEFDDYSRSLTVGTGDSKAVYRSFEYARIIIEECLEND